MGKAAIWKYYQHLTEKQRAKCNICDKEIGCKGGVTTPLHYHLKLHKTEYAEFEEEDKAKQKPKDKQPTLNQFLPKSNEHQQKLVDDAIARFLAESGSAFRITDLKSFKDIVRLASNGKLKAKSKTFYSKLVSDNAEEINQEGEMRKDIVSILAELKPFIKCVSFTTDLWTSVNGDPFI